MKKEDFDIRLKTAFLTRKEFSVKANVNYETVTKWNDIKRPVPSWVDSWLNNYIRAKVGDDIIDAVKPFVGK